MPVTKNATRKSSNANLKIVVVLVAVSLFFFVLLHYEISISKKAKDDILVTTSNIMLTNYKERNGGSTTSVAKTGKPRKVFVDLGANCGNSYYRHRKVHKDDADDWEVYLWEPSPQMHHFYLNDLKEEYPSVNIIPYAASVKDGEMELYVHEGQEHVTEKTQFRMQGECTAESRSNPSGGTTLFTGAKVAGDPVSVKVVNFPMWLKKLNLNEDDKFILKLDIEGAEFEILEQMLWDKDDNNLCLTELIQVEFHPGIAKADVSLDSKYITFDKDFPSIFKQKCGRNVNLEQLF